MAIKELVSKRYKSPFEASNPRPEIPSAGKKSGSKHKVKDIEASLLALQQISRQNNNNLSATSNIHVSG